MRALIVAIVVAGALFSVAAFALLRSDDGDSPRQQAAPDAVLETDASAVLARASDFLTRVRTYRANPTGPGGGALEIFIASDGRGYARSTSTRGQIEYFIRGDRMWVRIEGGPWESEDHLLRGLVAAYLPDAVLQDRTSWPSYLLEAVEACGPQRCYRLSRPLTLPAEAKISVLIGVEDFAPRAVVTTVTVSGSTATLTGATYDGFGQPIPFPASLPP